MYTHRETTYKLAESKTYNAPCQLSAYRGLKLRHSEMRVSMGTEAKHMYMYSPKQTESSCFSFRGSTAELAHHQMVLIEPPCSALSIHLADSKWRTWWREEGTERRVSGCLCWRRRVAGVINCDLPLILQHA